MCVGARASRLRELDGASSSREPVAAVLRSEELLLLHSSFSSALSFPRTPMGKAKKTRKYAAVKRLINPKDLKQ